MAGRFCQQCGAELPEAIHFCLRCGAMRLDDAPPPTVAPSPVVAPRPVVAPSPVVASPERPRVLRRGSRVALFFGVAAAAAFLGWLALGHRNVAAARAGDPPRSAAPAETAERGRSEPPRTTRREPDPAPAPREPDPDAAPRGRAREMDRAQERPEDGGAARPIVASSYLPDWRGYSFRPELAFDGRLDTSWQPQRPGVGAWIRIEFRRQVVVEGLDVANGFQREDALGDLFVQNARVARAHVKLCGHEDEPIALAFDPDRRGFSRFTFPATTTDCLTLVVDEISPGTRWPDVAISEIRVLGRE